MQTLRQSAAFNGQDQRRYEALMRFSEDLIASTIANVLDQQNILNGRLQNELVWGSLGNSLREQPFALMSA